MVGLGTGSLAAYGTPGQQFTYYEIDPLVKRIAYNPAYFTYIGEALERGVAVDVVLGDARLKLVAAYGYRARRSLPSEFRPGEGLVGKCAVEQKRIVMANVPSNYVRISSGLGDAAPRNLLILPVVFEGHVKGVIELVS